MGLALVRRRPVKTASLIPAPYGHVPIWGVYYGRCVAAPSNLSNAARSLRNASRSRATIGRSKTRNCWCRSRRYRLWPCATRNSFCGATLRILILVARGSGFRRKRRLLDGRRLRQRRRGGRFLKTEFAADFRHEIATNKCDNGDDRSSGRPSLAPAPTCVHLSPARRVLHL
jgi:hypothetical protein